MKFPTALLGIFLSCTFLSCMPVTALNIPRDLEPGDYIIEFPDTGNSSVGYLRKARAEDYIEAKDVSYIETWKQQDPGNFTADDYTDTDSNNPKPAIASNFSDTWFPDKSFQDKYHGYKQKDAWWRDHVPLPKRSKVKCISPQPVPSQEEYIEAKRYLFKFCDFYYAPPRRAYLGVSQNSQFAAYVCNWTKKPQPCSQREFEWAEKHLFDPKCGERVGARADLKGWGKGYGRGISGGKNCNLEEVIWVGGSNPKEG